MSKLKLKIITPLHIGGKEGRLSKACFALKDKKCYVVNEDKLAEELKEKRFIDEYVEKVKNMGRKFELGRFLQEKKISVEKVSQYFIDSGDSSPAEIIPFVRDAYVQPFIPATALKGAIRTAVLFELARNRKDFNSEAGRELDNVIHDKGLTWEQKKKRAGEFVQKYLQNYILNEYTKQDPHTDFLRCLRISDSNPIDKNSLKIEKIKVFSKSTGLKWFDIYLEAIPEGQEFEFEVKIDENTLHDFKEKNQNIPFSTLGELLKIVEKFFEELKKEENKFFQEANLTQLLIPVEANFRLGWGSGLFGTTIDMLLSDEIMEKVKRLFNWRNLFPKTRRVIVKNNKPVKTLGWGKLEII